jgi:cbb3-type cytochrome oxidase maturation protein
MESLYLLLPMSVLLVLAVIGLFAWALQAGQFDDLNREGWRVLEGSEAEPRPPPASVGAKGESSSLEPVRSEAARPCDITPIAAEPRSRHE